MSPWAPDPDFNLDAAYRPPRFIFTVWVEEGLLVAQQRGTPAHLFHLSLDPTRGSGPVLYAKLLPDLIGPFVAPWPDLTDVLVRLPNLDFQRWVWLRSQLSDTPAPPRGQGGSSLRTHLCVTQQQSVGHWAQIMTVSS